MTPPGGSTGLTETLDGAADATMEWDPDPECDACDACELWEVIVILVDVDVLPVCDDDDDVVVPSSQKTKPLWIGTLSVD